MSVVGVLGSRAFWGVAKEVTYGVPAAATHWVEIINSSLQETRDRRPRPYMSSFQQTHQVSSTFAEVGVDAGGDAELPILLDSVGTGLILEQVFGTVATTGAGPYTHTFRLEEGGVVGFTVHQEHGVHPTITDTTETFAGCRVNTMRLSAAGGEFPTMRLGIIGKSGSDLAALVGTAAFPDVDMLLAHYFTQPTWDSVVHPFLDWEIGLDRKLVRRRVVGDLFTDCPAPSAKTEITIRGRVRWNDSAIYQAFRDQTVSDLTIPIAGVGNNAGQITLHNVYWKSAVKSVSSEGELAFDMEGVAQADADGTRRGIVLALTNDNTTHLAA